VWLLPTVVGGAPSAFSLPRILDDFRRRDGEDAIEAFEAGLIAAREHPGHEVDGVHFHVRNEIESDLELCRVALTLVVPRGTIASYLAIESLEERT
jgi:hypothetical protein